MTDYVSCPRCQGRGLIPVEDAERAEVHGDVERQEQQREQAQRRLKDAQRYHDMIMAQQPDEAEQRRREAELLRQGAPREIRHATADEMAEMRARLADLADEP